MIADFDGRVAVVTGAASGIGYALAAKAAGLGMRLALADVERAALDSAAARLRALGAEALALETDVSDADSMRRFADQTLARYGAVHLLCNNAGVSGADSMLAIDLASWRWVLGVNLWGVVRGIRAFLPGMLERGEPGHIVNTASISGLASSPGMGSYNASKHAVIGLSETLHGELRNAGVESIGVSALCPSYVATQLYRSARNQPDAVAPAPDEQRAALDAAGEFFREHGMDADAVAGMAFDAVRANRFYVLTHPEGSKALVRRRMQGILDGGAPDMRGPEEFPV